jgi:hypothetical protein
VPKLELSGKKWMVEHFVGNRNIQVSLFKTYKFIKFLIARNVICFIRISEGDKVSNKIQQS